MLQETTDRSKARIEDAQQGFQAGYSAMQDFATSEPLFQSASSPDNHNLDTENLIASPFDSLLTVLTAS